MEILIIFRLKRLRENSIFIFKATSMVGALIHNEAADPGLPPFIVREMLSIPCLLNPVRKNIHCTLTTDGFFLLMKL